MKAKLRPTFAVTRPPTENDVFQSPHDPSHLITECGAGMQVSGCPSALGREGRSYKTFGKDDSREL
jgi:hypothetical protein